MIDMNIWRSTCGVVANALHCSIEGSEFDLRSRYDVHFRTNILGKDINVFRALCFGWHSIIAIILSYDKYGFGIKWHIKDDMPLNEWNWEYI